MFTLLYHMEILINFYVSTKIAAFDLMVRLVYLVGLTNLYGCRVHTVVGILGLATLI